MPLFCGLNKQKTMIKDAMKTFNYFLKAKDLSNKG